MAWLHRKLKLTRIPDYKIIVETLVNKPIEVSFFDPVILNIYLESEPTKVLICNRKFW